MYSLRSAVNSLGVKTLHHAGKMANATTDLSEFRSFSEKVKSNRLLQDKKIGFDWLPPFELLAKHKGLAAKKTKSPDKAGLKKRGKEGTSLMVVL
jgi:hypothetical protein